VNVQSNIARNSCGDAITRKGIKDVEWRARGVQRSQHWESEIDIIKASASFVQEEIAHLKGDGWLGNKNLTECQLIAI